MGYTHSWYRVAAFPVDPWAAFVEDAKAIVSEVSRRGIALADEYGDEGTAPVVGGIIVRFNGMGPAAHESFRMERFFCGPPSRVRHDLFFDWCKTQRKPYDLAVTALLVAAKRRFGSLIVVQSDGGETEWVPARALCRSILGAGADVAVPDPPLKVS